MKRVSLRRLSAFRRTDNLGRIQPQLRRNQINVFVVFPASFDRQRSCERLTIYRNICDSSRERIDRLLSAKSTDKQILVARGFIVNFHDVVRNRLQSIRFQNYLATLFFCLPPPPLSPPPPPSPPISSPSSAFPLSFSTSPAPPLHPPLPYRKKLNSSRNLTVVYLE